MEVLRDILRKCTRTVLEFWDETDHLLQGWLMFELLFVALLFVETRGVTLEEVAKIFDGEDAEVAHVDLDVVQEKVQTLAVTEVEDVRPEHKV